MPSICSTAEVIQANKTKSTRIDPAIRFQCAGLHLAFPNLQNVQGRLSFRRTVQVRQCKTRLCPSYGPVATASLHCRRHPLQAFRCLLWPVQRLYRLAKIQGLSRFVTWIAKRQMRLHMRLELPSCRLVCKRPKRFAAQTRCSWTESTSCTNTPSVCNRQVVVLLNAKKYTTCTNPRAFYRGVDVFRKETYHCARFKHPN